MGRPHRRKPGTSRVAAARRVRRVLGDGVFAGASTAVGFLLLCWPFVRTPPPDAAATLAYVFAVWAAFIAVLAAMMAARGREAPRRKKEG